MATTSSHQPSLTSLFTTASTPRLNLRPTAFRPSPIKASSSSDEQPQQQRENTVVSNVESCTVPRSRRRRQVWHLQEIELSQRWRTSSPCRSGIGFTFRLIPGLSSSTSPSFLMTLTKIYIKVTGDNNAEMVTDEGAIYLTLNRGYNWRAAVQETVSATLNRCVTR